MFPIKSQQTSCKHACAGGLADRSVGGALIGVRPSVLADSYV
jgi:hypothetical protein